jgi:hypothetical protein
MVRNYDFISFIFLCLLLLLLLLLVLLHIYLFFFFPFMRVEDCKMQFLYFFFVEANDIVL